MKESIREANEKGMPIYAECGGLMYLCESIHDFEGAVYDTVGIVPANCIMQQKLQKVGYVTATAKRDNLLLQIHLFVGMSSISLRWNQL